MNKKLIIAGFISAAVIGSGVAVALQTTPKTTNNTSPAAAIQQTKPSSVAPSQPIAPTQETVTQEDTNTVAEPAPYVPAEPLPETARTYEELVEFYNFKGVINTEGLTTLKMLFPDRFTPENIEHTFSYLRKISSSVDPRFVRTYGWDLPQYQ